MAVATSSQRRCGHDVGGVLLVAGKPPGTPPATALFLQLSAPLAAQFECGAYVHSFHDTAYCPTFNPGAAAMVWLRLSDDFYDHPKVAPLDNDAFALLVTVMLYSNRFHADGFIDEDMMRTIARARDLQGNRAGKSIAALEAKGALRRVEVGWLIADEFQKHQPTSSEVEERRERERLKKQRQRAASRGMSQWDADGESPRESRGSPGTGTGEDDEVIPAAAQENSSKSFEECSAAAVSSSSSPPGSPGDTTGDIPPVVLQFAKGLYTRPLTKAEIHRVQRLCEEYSEDAVLGALARATGTNKPIIYASKTLENLGTVMGDYQWHAWGSSAERDKERWLDAAADAEALKISEQAS